MAFDTSAITEVLPPAREGSRLTLEWTSSAPAGTYFQVYIQGGLAWWGTERHVTVAAPRGLIDVQIGSVADGEQTTDFAGVGLDVFGFDAGGLSGLGTAPITTRAYLAWSGFGASIYRIFEGAAGFDLGGFDTGSFNGVQLGSVTALEQGLSTDGFDLGGFDTGGLDTQGGNYSFTSRPLARGTWNLSVVPYNAAGNAGTPSLTTVTITAPPRPPSPNLGAPTRKRLAYTYDAGTQEITLTWLASPG